MNDDEFYQNPFQNEKFLLRIAANDPSIGDIQANIDINDLNTVTVTNRLFRQIGQAVAKNTTLKQLCINLPHSDHFFDIDGWLRCVELIGKNRSIESFLIYGTEGYTNKQNRTYISVLGGKSILALDKFFLRNNSLSELCLYDASMDESNAVAAVLAKRVCPLKSVGVLGSGAIEMLRLLSKDHSKAIPKNIFVSDVKASDIETLVEFFEMTTGIDIEALTLEAKEENMVESDEENMEESDEENMEESDEEDIQGWHVLSIANALAQRDSPIGKLDISSMADCLDLAHIAAAFDENPDIFPNKLDISLADISVAGGVALGNLLLKRSCPMEELDCRDSDPTSGSMNLLRVLRDDPSKCPRTLMVAGWPKGKFHIKALLQHPHCSLEKLNLPHPRDVAVDDYNDDDFDFEDDDFENQISTICCNPKSIESTYFASNHRLSDGIFECPKLCRYLRMNRSLDKKKVARIKVYDTHFAHCVDFAPFRDLQASLPELLPFIDRAYGDYEEFVSEDITDEKEVQRDESWNNSLNIHFLMLKNNPSLLHHHSRNQVSTSNTNSTTTSLLVTEKSKASFELVDVVAALRRENEQLKMELEKLNEEINEINCAIDGDFGGEKNEYNDLNYGQVNQNFITLSSEMTITATLSGTCWPRLSSVSRYYPIKKRAKFVAAEEESLDSSI